MTHRPRRRSTPRTVGLPSRGERHVAAASAWTWASTSTPSSPAGSLRVAGDVLPLLVNACSAACLERLPAPPEGYVPGPHRGGLELEQPPTRF